MITITNVLMIIIIIIMYRTCDIFSPHIVCKWKGGPLMGGDLYGVFCKNIYGTIYIYTHIYVCTCVYTGVCVYLYIYIVEMNLRLCCWSSLGLYHPESPEGGCRFPSLNEEPDLREVADQEAPGMHRVAGLSPNLNP